MFPEMNFYETLCYTLSFVAVRGHPQNLSGKEMVLLFKGVVKYMIIFPLTE